MRQPDLFAQTESRQGRNQRWLLRLWDVANTPRPFLSAANAYRSLHGLLWIERHLNEPARARVPLILLV